MQGLNTRREDFDSKIQEIIPWARPNPLTEAIDEKEKEKLEVIELIENLADHGELPSEVKLLVKKPKKEELMEE